jgi:C4-type Zn-finger protein
LEYISFNSWMTAAPASRVRLAEVVDGDLVCWKCKDRLIAGYVDLLDASGPVPFFGEMTIACTKCSCANRSPGAATAGTRSGPASEAEAQASKDRLRSDRSRR